MAGQSITIAELLVKIGVEGSDAKKAADGVGTSLGETKKKAKSLKSGMQDLGKAFAKFAAVVAGAATAVFAFVNSVAKVGDEIGKTSKKIGAGVEELQRLRFAADRSGASAKSLDLAIKNQAKALQDASKGGAKLFTDALEDLGLSIADVNKLTAEERLGLFGDRLKEIEDGGKRTALAMNLFGARAGPELLPLLLEGSEGIRSLGDEAEALGIVMSEDAVASSEGFVDSVTNLQAALSGVKNIIGTDLIPVVQELVEGFTKWVATNRDVLRQKVRSFLEGIVRVAKKLIPVVEVMAEAFLFLVNNLDKLLFILGGVKLAQAFGAVATGLNAMGVAATTALGPIGVIAGALLALIPIAISVGEAIGDALSADATPRTKTRGAVGTFGAEFGAGVEASQAVGAQKIIERELALLGQKGRDKDSQASKNARARLEKARATKDRARAAFQKRQAAEAAATAARRSEDAAEGEEFGAFDSNVANVREALGIGDGPVSAKQQAKLDKAFSALAEDPTNLKAARKAAGLDRRRGGGGKGKGKKPKDEPAATAPKVTSPTTLSEFFGAAGRGELGPIAARTPSTKDIEPTVAIDITNNNFKFDVKQTISGTTSAADTAKEVAKAIRVEFQTRLASAGQQLATNVVR